MQFEHDILWVTINFIKCSSSYNKNLMFISALTSGADPENFHGRWLTGWLPRVNHTGAKGGGWLIMVDIIYVA